MFFDREEELAFLDELLARERPARAQLILLYGRRRVGKTALARHWAATSGLPSVYWAAEREPAALQRRKLYAQILGVAQASAPLFDTWADLWGAIAASLDDRRRILILDEVAYAADSDPAFLTALQHAWDQHLKESGLILLLSGSHVHTMETLLARGSPLFGRFTGQWLLRPLPFSSLRQFLPGWGAEARVAAYAIVGGVPAYLEWLDPEASLSENLKRVILAPGSIFLAEPALLLYDEVREPRVYHAILQAIGGGAHSLDEISGTALVSKTNLSAYLARLQELRLVERRVPVTLPRRKRRVSRKGRYHLADPFFRFYYRFLEPHQASADRNPDQLLPEIEDQLRGFVGSSAFEALCRRWLAKSYPAERLETGSHWNRRVQIDAVGVNWQGKTLLHGECKWGGEKIGRGALVAYLEERAPLLQRDLPRAGAGWTLRPHYFARAGFTPAAREWADEHGLRLVDLATLDRAVGESRAAQA